MKIQSLFLLILITFSTHAVAESKLGFRLENFDYPYPVEMMELSSQQQQLEMAYMDVKPTATAKGKTVVMFHGKNFCAATWGDTMTALLKKGYRVIAVDQVGFCKSSKPVDYQYSFHQLAANTNTLIEKLGIEHAIIMGHSMGGMLATRYALLYPSKVDALILVNPIGLEDWLAKGVPYISIKQWYQSQLKVDKASIKRYQKSTYYAGEWHPEYQHWVDMLAMQYKADRKKSAWLSAFIYDMIITQPVLYEFDQLEVPTWLFIGGKDNTAVGKGFVSDKVKKTLGHYPELAEKSAKAIPSARLVMFDDLGHSPQIQAPERFQKALIDALDSLNASP